jgi:TP901 family phage tail tape measure protein
MGKEVFELAILIALKDAASAGSDRVADKLRKMATEEDKATKKLRDTNKALKDTGDEANKASKKLGDTGKGIKETGDEAGKAAPKLGEVGKKLGSTSNAARDTLTRFQELRKDFNRGLIIGGVGIAGMKMLKDGAKTAGDFESAMTELRLSIEEAGSGGAVNLGQLNDQLNRFESLGVKLGNQLPGTTKDFIDMFVALKQGGLQTETILKGAGEQVAYLSVLTHNSPSELGKAYAQIGEMFALKPEEYAQSAEIFLKNFRAVGLRPEDMIEGAKFAQLRGGLPLGFKGLKGMENMSSLLGMLKVMGLEGSIGGRELADVLMHLPATTKAQQKADAALKKKGIDLKFFDDKGEYLGSENMIRELAKLHSLNAVERGKLVKERFGSQEAVGPVTVFAEQGLEGLEKYKKRVAAVAPLQSQLNELTETYNQKMEALEGTLENLKAAAFTPLIDKLKPALDIANTLVGDLQEFAKDHEPLVKTATNLAAIGTTAVVLGGTIMSLRAKWNMWKIAIAVGNGEKGLLDFFGNLRTETGKAALGVEMAGAKAERAAGRLGGRMGNALTGAIKGTLVTFAIEAAIEQVMERGYQVIESRQAKAEIAFLEAQKNEIGKKLAKFSATPEEAEKYWDIDRQIGELQVQAINASRSKDVVSMFADPSKFASDIALAAHPNDVWRQGIFRSIFNWMNPGN